MRKVYKVEIDCANCASKVEKAISKLEGVISVNVNFMTQKMLFEAEDSKFNELLDEAYKVGKKIERDFVIYK